MRHAAAEQDLRSRAVRVAESALVAAGGGALGWSFGWIVHPVVGWVFGAIAIANGAVSGWRGVYAWSRGDGWLAFVLDSTWASTPVAVGLVAHLGAAMMRDAGLVQGLSFRQNRHVYRRGVALKPGFAFTIGNVISGAGNVDSVRRRRLITDHEHVHVWQSRWFGPLYPMLYLSWSLGGVVAGTAIWLVRRRRSPQRLAKVIESCSYYTNPFEWWAYSRDDLWPPPGKLAGVGWRGAAVRPLSTLGRRTHAGSSRVDDSDERDERDEPDDIDGAE